MKKIICLLIALLMITSYAPMFGVEAYAATMSADCSEFYHGAWCEHGTITLKTKNNNNASYADGGRRVTVEIDPNNGYEVDKVTVEYKYNDRNGWEHDDSFKATKIDADTYEFIMPNNAKNGVKVKVTYKPIPVTTYDIIVDPAITDGEVEVKVNGVVSNKAKKDETVTINVKPNTGMEVQTITVKKVSGSFVSNNNTFTMPDEDVVISVTFKKINYNIRKVSEYGSFDVLKNGTSVNKAQYGDSLTIGNIVPNSGYEFKGISVNGVAKEFPFTMPASNIVVFAIFEPIPVTTYTVTVDDSVKDYVSVDKTEAEEGETVTVTATPEEGYVVDEIVVEKTNNDEAELVAVAEEDEITVTENDDGTYSFNMPAYAVTVKATFAPITHKVTYYDIEGNILEEFTVEHGSDVPENDIPALPYNEEYPEEAYNQNSAWDHDGQDIVEDTEIRPSFVINEYEVKYFVEGEQYGETQMVKHGEDAVLPEFPYTEDHPEEAYDQESGWDDDGKYITEDTRIDAVYTINKYTVKFTFMGFVVKEQIVEHGSDAEPPMLMTNHRWDKSFRNITEDTVIKAIVGRPADKTPAAPEKTEDEANPNTGAPINGVSVLGAVVLLAGATCFIGKK